MSLSDMSWGFDCRDARRPMTGGAQSWQVSLAPGSD